MILRKYKYCYGIIIELQYSISLAESFIDSGTRCFIVVIYLFGIVYGNTDTYRTILNNVLSGKLNTGKGNKMSAALVFLRISLTFLRILNIESVH